MAYTSGNLFCGEKTGITTTPVQISTTVAQHIREVLIQADSTNTTTVLIGNSTAQEVELTAGQSITLPVISIALIWVKMASGTGIVNFIARD